MIHPKHWVELDCVPEKFSRMGKFDGIRLNADMVNEDGFPTSIVVEIGDDEQAARSIADRLRRCWNLMRDVKDHEINNVVLCSKTNVLAAMEMLHDQIDEIMNPLRGE